MDAWIVEGLKSLGPSGILVGLMAVAIGALWRQSAAKDRQIAGMHKERVAERDVAVKALEASNTAALATATATERRNQVMDDLGDAFTAQASALEKYDERVRQLTEMLKDRFAEFKHVVDAFGESNRVGAGLMQDIRSAVQTLDGDIRQLEIRVASNGGK